MKKLLALAGIALIAAACTNNDEPVLSSLCLRSSAASLNLSESIKN